MRLEFFIPLRTGRGLNERLHWAARMVRTKTERRAGRLATKSEWAKLARLVPPLRITLSRVKPKGIKLDDDNLRSSLKSVRDGIADALGINDGNEKSATWHYGQLGGEWGVRVLIEDST